MDLALYSTKDSQSKSLELYLDRVSNHVISLLATLGESPQIHYFNPKITHATLSAHLAARTSQKLESLRNAFPDSYKQHDPFGNQAKLFILDRNADAISPFLHDLHYQSLLHDCLPVDGNKVTYDTSEEPGVVSELKEEDDELWRKNRHALFFQATQSVSNAFKEFLEENKAAVQVSAGEKIDVSDLVDVGRNVMTFNEEKAKV
jgi:syntaxin-binding protein 1